MATIFVTGGSGYMGRSLIGQLLQRGHSVRAVARQGSERKLPAGCTVIIGDVLDERSYTEHVAGSDVFVHLVGVPHPSPAKAAEFSRVDLVSIRKAVIAATTAGVPHLVYVSVAHPAPMMHDYIAVRSQGEEMIRAAGLNATILRPWYVVGPGHRWPVVLLPAYWLLERLPTTRQAAQRLGLVSLPQMVAALVNAVENQAPGVRIMEVPEIRRAGIG
jgi:uncharacterized protein YbjT (DUF2867 family)